MNSIDVKYSRTIKTIQLGSDTLEVKASATGTYWGLFRNGQKVTEFMNCRGSCAGAHIDNQLVQMGGERVFYPGHRQL